MDIQKIGLTASGSELKKIGEMLRTHRHVREKDHSFRLRLKTILVNIHKE